MSYFLDVAYRDDEGKPWVLPIVRSVEDKIIANKALDKEYLPVLGYEPLTTAATKILLGEDSPSLVEGRATGIQCLSGTGALRVGADFLVRVAKFSVVYASNPTWGIFLNNLYSNNQSSYLYFIINIR